MGGPDTELKIQKCLEYRLLRHRPALVPVAVLLLSVPPGPLHPGTGGSLRLQTGRQVVGTRDLVEGVPFLLLNSLRLLPPVVGPSSLLVHPPDRTDDLRRVPHCLSVHRQVAVPVVVHPPPFVRLVDVHELPGRVLQPRDLRHPLQGVVDTVVDLLAVPVQTVPIHVVLVHVRPRERRVDRVPVVVSVQRGPAVVVLSPVLRLEVEPVEE